MHNHAACFGNKARHLLHSTPPKMFVSSSESATSCTIHPIACNPCVTPPLPNKGVMRTHCIDPSKHVLMSKRSHESTLPSACREAPNSLVTAVNAPRART